MSTKSTPLHGPHPPTASGADDFIHAFIITWPGKHDGARHIAREIEGGVDRLTVLYANKDDRAEESEPSWRQFPNSWYFGAQFREMIRQFEGDVLLHVMADAQSDDWPQLVRSLRQALCRLPAMGIWSPNVDHSAQPLEEVSLGPLTHGALHQVLQSDCTVWALSADVVEHMRRFDYDRTPLGWGIDIAAALYCHSVGKPVIIDAAVQVLHPRTSGYDSTPAEVQKAEFLKQLSVREKLIRGLLARRLPRAFRRAMFSIIAPNSYRRAVGGLERRCQTD